MVPDEQLRIAAADQREEEQCISMPAQLGGASGEEHHGPVAEILHPLHAGIEAVGGEQAAAHEDHIGLGHAGVLHGAFQQYTVGRVVGVDEHAQQGAVLGTGLLQEREHAGHDANLPKSGGFSPCRSPHG